VNQSLLEQALVAKLDAYRFLQNIKIGDGPLRFLADCLDYQRGIVPTKTH
jgi:hypothetical protein